MLLHEIAHVRAGDHLLLGLGSPFVGFVNLWFPVLVLTGVVPLIGFGLAQYPTTASLGAQLVLMVSLVPRTLLLPVAALWCAELAADRAAVAAGLRAGLLTAMNATHRGGGRRRGALLHLSHPPAALRRRALHIGYGRDVLMLVAWPLTSLVLLVVIVVQAALAGWLNGASAPDIVAQLREGSTGFLVDNALLWVPSIVLLAGWPALGRSWARWWSGAACAAPPTMARDAYPVAATVVGVVMAGALALLGLGP